MEDRIFNFISFVVFLSSGLLTIWKPELSRKWSLKLMRWQNSFFKHVSSPGNTKKLLGYSTKKIRIFGVIVSALSFIFLAIFILSSAPK